MALFNFDSFSFSSLPLLRREEKPYGTYEVFFPKPRGFSFKSGEVVAIHKGEPKEARLYSIASAENDEYLSFLYSYVEGGYLTPSLSEAPLGTSFYISPSFGDFILGDNPAIWICIGTGVAPFLSYVRTQENKVLDNKILIQGSRFLDSFWGQDIFNTSSLSSYIRCCSSLKEGEKEGFYAGRLTHFVKEAKLPKENKVYLCGNPQMIIQVRDILLQKGFSLENIISEVYF